MTPVEANEKLIAALESGEFTQAKKQLRVCDSYCCLGVACELYRREVGDDKAKWAEGIVFPPFRVKSRERNYGYPDYFDSEFLVAPMEVAKYYGWDHLEPSLYSSPMDTVRNPRVALEALPEAVREELAEAGFTHPTVALATLNDKTSLGFAGIAKVIREQILPRVKAATEEVKA